MLIANIKTQEEARQFAIDWQHNEADKPMSWAEIAEWHNIFTLLGAKFNLTDEFKENGLI